MKKSLLIAAAALALAAGTAGPAAAVDFTAFGSYWDTQDADNALGGGVKLRFGIVELRGTYFSDVTADTDPERFDFEVQAIPLEAGLAFKFAQNDTFSPYVGGGAGYYLLDTNIGEVDDEIGYYAVLGADFGSFGSSGNMAINAEAIYRSMEATVRNEDDLTNPNIDDDVAFNLDGLGVNVGLTWRF